MAAERKISAEGDEYWGVSTAKKGTTRRNIFDDDVSFDKAKQLLTASPFKTTCDDDDEDDQDDDLVSWTGDPVVKFNRPSFAPKPPDLSNLAVPFTSPAVRSSTHTPGSSVFGEVGSSTSHSRSQSLGNSNQFGLQKSSMTRGISDPSIEEVVKNSSPTSGKKVPPTSSDMDKLQKEIIFLKKELQVARRQRWQRQPVEDTIRRMVIGETFTFEMYKSREDKLALLDKAIESHDGNAIVAAVLFLKKTVKSSILNLELMRRPIAVNHYIHYLKCHYDFTQLVDLLGMLGRTEEAAMLKYKIACASKDPTMKIGCLKTCQRSHFSTEPLLARQSALLQEHIDLLERQRPVEENDAKAEAQGQTPIFRDFPRRASLFDQPVTTSLYYFCLYHFDLGENSLASPYSLKARHNVTDKQFLWSAVGARSKLRRWKDIELLLTAKGWFGGTKMKALIGFDKVAEILFKNKAPHDVLAKYVALIEDLDLRVVVAKKVECPKAVIDAYTAQKDKGQLEAYTASLKPRSVEAAYGHDVLRSSTIKWR